MKKFGDMTPSELDKMLLDYVLKDRDSFYSDKELAEMKSVANSVMKELFFNQDPKQIEKENEEFLNMLRDEQARRKLQQAVKDKPQQHISDPIVIGEEPDSIHLQKPTDSEKVTRYDAGGGPYCLEKKKIEWKSEIGSKFEEGYIIKSQVKPPYPVMTREEVRKFAQYILNVTTETNYRGV